MTPGVTAFALRARLARQLSLACYGLLLLAISIEACGIVTLQPGARAVLWLMVVGPLMVFLPGLLRATWKTYLWLCFVLLIYFMLTVNRLFEAPLDAMAWCQLVLICVLFVAAMFYARWRQRELAAGQN